MNNAFLTEFEASYRRLASSIEYYRMRPANNALLVSFTDQKDFLATVGATAGANIALRIGWLQVDRGRPCREIRDCFLRFELTNACVDERLTVFLAALALEAKE